MSKKHMFYVYRSSPSVETGFEMISMHKSRAWAERKVHEVEKIYPLSCIFILTREDREKIYSTD